MKWHACFPEHFSKAEALHAHDYAIEPNAEQTDAEFQSQVALEYFELKLAVRESYFDFDWNSWTKAACLVQKEAECFYANHLLSDDLQTISQARALDRELNEVLTIARQLMIDLGPLIKPLSEKITKLQPPANEHTPMIQQERQGELELKVSQLITAWKEFLTDVLTLERLSRDIKLAYSPIAVDAAEQNQPLS